MMKYIHDVADMLYTLCTKTIPNAGTVYIVVISLLMQIVGLLNVNMGYVPMVYSAFDLPMHHTTIDYYHRGAH